MGRKMTISSLFKTRGGGGLLAVPLCYNAKTTSFRVGDDVIKTVNSVFFDQNGDVLEAETPDSWFTNSSESASYSTESDQDLDAESVEMVVRGVVRSERLFFDPGVTSSILKGKQDNDNSQSEEDRDYPPLEGSSVAVEMESEDPYGDFRRSMEEMVRSQEELAKDWESLEALLAWYLKMNEKRSHGVIVSAFADLLVSISGGGTTSTPASESTRYSTAVSSLPSSPVYSSRGQNEIEEEERRSC
ncbi:PREDICTED: transcription repressor OFP13-like [Tarenaya hassleriana]|uniref:transcription repressor OFP13-like n=1 Tax=Tarenaya hassleriana TaxID=28532 RepID=UPI00053C707A|nr:PREDICTED: transcription repressor OFP13-like [Tarenaya hassleriana]